jgi:hypothetical protein
LKIERKKEHERERKGELKETAEKIGIQKEKYRKRKEQNGTHM